MQNLNALNAQLDALPPGTDVHFRCYLIGALAGVVDPKVWDDALQTAQACVDRYSTPAVAS